MPTKTDAELVALASRGNKETFGTLVERYQVLPQGKKLRRGYSKTPARDALMKEAR